MADPGPWARRERMAVLLVALHSYALGAALLLGTGWTLHFAGWDRTVEPFFPRQSGAFHVVLATGYLLEHFRHRGIALLVVAKAAAVVFLVALNPWRAAWSVPVSGVLDGVMLAGVVWLHRRARAG